MKEIEKTYEAKKFEDEIYKKWEDSGLFTPKISKNKKRGFSCKKQHRFFEIKLLEIRKNKNHHNHRNIQKFGCPKIILKNKMK